MRIEYEIQEHRCILRLQGRFFTGSDSDYARVRKQLRKAEIRIAIADCSELPYVDSTGLAFMVGLHQDMAAASGRFAMFGINARVREVLQLTRLDRELAIYPDEGEALEALDPTTAVA